MNEPIMTTEALAARATQAEKTLRATAPLAQAVVVTARQQMREIGANWKLAPSQQAEGKRRIRQAAHAELAELENGRRIAVNRVGEYRERVARLPVPTTLDAELRRGRHYTALEKAVEGEKTRSGREVKFMQLVVEAEKNADLPTLEAARELGRALALRGVPVSADLTRHLDAIAGGPTTRDAAQMEQRCVDGAGYTGIALGHARQVLDDSPNEESGIMGADFDGKAFVIDTWAPETNRVVQRGERVIHE